MAQSEHLKLNREPGQPWGFRLQGGKDFSCPLTIVRVNGKSQAEASGLKVGHCILSINGSDTIGFSHQDALEAIVNAKDELDLIVKKLELGPLWNPKSRPTSKVWEAAAPVVSSNIITGDTHAEKLTTITALTENITSEANPQSLTAASVEQFQPGPECPSVPPVINQIEDALPSTQLEIHEQVEAAELEASLESSFQENVNHCVSDGGPAITDAGLADSLMAGPECSSFDKTEGAIITSENMGVHESSDVTKIPETNSSTSDTLGITHYEIGVKSVSESHIFDQHQVTAADELLFESIYNASHHEHEKVDKDHAIELLTEKLPHELTMPLQAKPPEPPVEIDDVIAQQPVSQISLEHFPPPCLDFKIVDLSTGSEVSGDQLIQPPPEASLNDPNHVVCPALVPPEISSIPQQFSSVLGYDRAQIVQPHKPINVTVNSQYIPNFFLAKEEPQISKPFRHSFLEDKYTEDEIAETLTSQAEILNTGVIGVDFQKKSGAIEVNKDSEVYKMVHNLVKDPPTGICALPERIDVETKSPVIKALSSSDKGMKSHVVGYFIKRLIKSYLNNGKKRRPVT